MSNEEHLGLGRGTEILNQFQPWFRDVSDLKPFVLGCQCLKHVSRPPGTPPVHTRKPAEMDVDFYTKTYGFDPNIDLIITWLLFPPQCETWTLAAVLTAQKLIELGGHS